MWAHEINLKLIATGLNLLSSIDPEDIADMFLFKWQYAHIDLGFYVVILSVLFSIIE